jgi:uncharacterized protein (TIGR03435 family)
MNRTTKIILTSAAAVLLIAAAVAVKLAFFPSVNDAWFQINQQKLRRVPKNLVVVRPTHFPDSPAKSSPPGMTQVRVNQAWWMVGRNVSLQQLMAAAYSYNPGRIALPPNAPKHNFDFLVTVPTSPQERLQAAIKRKLGYTAQKEMRDTDVLALKVQDPNSPGLTVSSGTRGGVSQKNGRLYFTHQRLTVVTDGLEGMLKTPVVDETGLTNFYDFSLVWDPQTAKQIQSGTLDSETGKKILAEWGLGLEPDTASIEMLVVKKVY